MKSLLLSAMLLVSSGAFAELVYDRPVNDKIDSGAIEYFIQGKGGATPKGNAACEDGLFYNDHFIALYDGATDKSGKSYNGKKGGRIAEEIIENVFKGLPPEASKEETLARINRSYQDFYKAHPEMDFVKNTTWRPTATLIWYSFARRELVAIGDSKARIDGVNINKKSKLVDDLNSELRVRVIKQLKLSEADIAQNDLGRFYILPLLERQSDYQNNPKAPKAFQYWAIDGFDVPAEEVLVWRFDQTPKLIELSSDGYENYPAASNVKAYEEDFANFLKEDPQRIKYPSTKGLQQGNVSFDDRAVLIYQAK
ncbi:MAG: hypothetical protein H6R17_2790 [Proteobacteria bacterium]|nr:hypothetical protein [Pseudomonadota bacterium]